ncbi:MAG: NAD(P)H-dependent oxidoreductase subunit E [Planctomycetota bacterium]|nr:NAD(P)H-dependent oxidoreductase subunit E [Planctomycetota bacterium]
MDLRHHDVLPTAAERSAVDALLGVEAGDAPPAGFAAVRDARTLLLPALHALQSSVGWVSRGGLDYVCRRLGVPPAEAFGVASFYALFSLVQRPQAFAHVCDDIACTAAGAEKVCSELERKLGAPASGHAKTGTAHEDGAGHGPRWARSPCLGLCERAPAALVTIAGAEPKDCAFGAATASRIEAALAGSPPRIEEAYVASSGPRRLLARVGVADPASLAAYRAHRGYEALARAFELGAEGVLREVTESKLVGRGGAAFPTGRKWEAVARATARPHYVVCNADESEPGTFKDRVLLEGDPFAVVEAMTIAGYATGSQRGYLYLRGEYPLALERLSHAIESARAGGLLGANILGSGFAFDIELRRGAGAYICGEETALFNSIEGLRGEPRNKPPFPAQVGLFGRPTAVNNVETLVAVLDIVRDGAASYTSVGTAGSPGTKLFCVSGSVVRPGVYEVPFGTRLDALLALAGGVLPGKTMRTILLGGAAGGFVGRDQLSLPLSFEDTRKAGTTLGSGVVLVFDDETPMVPILRRIAAFFRDESCGQCIPCRVGTVRQEELLSRVVNGRSTLQGELPLLKDLGQVMRDASICGLGQTASSAIESAVALGLFEDER